MVFDNGSCEEAIEYLVDEHQQGKIQHLILSEKNLGKGGAWNITLKAAPGEIIAYSDNDAYFYQGWLSKSVEILEAFPKVGMVTSRPFRTLPDLYSKTVEWAENTPKASVEQGQFIPWDVFKVFEMSLGMSEEKARERYEVTHDVHISFNGVSAHAGASHWQFLTFKCTIEQFLPFSMDRPMGQVRSLDQRMNDAGYLRLMPCEPLAQNMSNRLDWIHDPSELKQAPTKSSLRKKILNLSPVKRILLGFYNRVFQWYYET
jgi:glycosyltransferase involved in cell wall biosynthesis